MVLEQLDKREPQPLPNSIKIVNLCWIIDLKLTAKIKASIRQYGIISSRAGSSQKFLSKSQKILTIKEKNDKMKFNKI